MHAEVKWVEGLTFLATSESGHGFVMDGPVTSGGNNRGPSPMELLLIGAGGCTGIDVTLILKNAKQEVTGLSIRLDSVRNDTDPKIFTHIKFVYTFKGNNLSRKAVERAVKMSAEKYCCVSIMLGKTASIEHEIIIEDEVA